MKKNLIRTAVALAGLGAAQTFAGVVAKDYTAATSPAAIPVANEAVISAATGTAVNVIGALTFETGFAVSTTARYARINLSSGTWGAAQPATTTQYNTQANAITESLASGGATTDNFVIYEVVAPVAGNAIAGTVDLTFTPATGIVVKDKSDVSITYSLYETAGDAVSQTSALATDTGALITFTEVTNVNSTDTAAVATTAPNIDVQVATKTGKIFSGGTATGLVGVVNIDDTASIELLDGSAASTSALTASNVLTVTGDFTWLQDLDSNNAPDGTYTLADAFLDDTNNCAGSGLAGPEAETITDTNMTFTTTAYNNDTLYVCVTGNEVSDIPVQTFTANYSTVGATGYASESTDLTLFSHAKNGSTSALNLVLNPTGAYKNFLRVTNLSTVTGDVTFSLTNDSGTTVNNVSLGAISGQASSALAGGNSTSMIDIADLYAAAQATLATFDVGTGKLRVSVTGNFGSMDVQNITTATDNTSFDTF